MHVFVFVIIRMKFEDYILRERNDPLSNTSHDIAIMFSPGRYRIASREWLLCNRRVFYQSKVDGRDILSSDCYLNHEFV